jgi:hypothetical protein
MSCLCISFGLLYGQTARHFKNIYRKYLLCDEYGKMPSVHERATDAREDVEILGV